MGNVAYIVNEQVNYFQCFTILFVVDFKLITEKFKLCQKKRDFFGINDEIKDQ